MANIVNIDFKEKFQALKVQLSLNIRPLELFRGHMLSTNQVGFYTKIISSFTFACIREEFSLTRVPGLFCMQVLL